LDGNSRHISAHLGNEGKKTARGQNIDLWQHTVIRFY
jgi:hypothetical protein